MSPAPELSPRYSEVLHRLRAVLAFVVLVNHVRQLWWVSYDELAAGERSPVVQVLYFFTAFGSGAVTLFFVLSGYLITRKYLPSLQQGEGQASGFLTGRAVRLYVVFVPTLVLSFLLATLRGAEQYRDGVTFVANLAFLMPNVAPVFAENVPLWSLGYEGRAYLAFFLVASSLYARREKMWGRLTLQVTALIGLLVVGGVWNVHYFGIWALGALAAILERSTAFQGASLRVSRRRWLLAGGLTLVALVAARCGLPTPLRDWLIGVPAAFFFAGGAAALQQGGPFRSAWGRPLSDMSYSLYLTHFPLLLAIKDSQLGRLRPGVEGWMLLVGGSVACVVFAWAFSQVTERHTGAVRRWARRLG